MNLVMSPAPFASDCSKKAFTGMECRPAAEIAISANDPGRFREGATGRYAAGILGRWFLLANITARQMTVFPKPIVSARIPPRFVS